MRGRKSDIADGQRLFKADGKTILITPRYKRRTRGRTDGGIGIALSKAHAARGERIERRGYVIATTVAAPVCVAEINGHYAQNLGSPTLRPLLGGGGDCGGEANPDRPPQCKRPHPRATAPQQ